MHTVTFYSYKGGVGRTLVVANVAKYVARLGMKVFVLDFDLEAPGVHYKLEGEEGKPLKVERGLVDILATFTTSRRLPEPLTTYVIEVPSPAFATGTIHLLPAGDAPSSAYWRQLSKVDWHALFYAENADGIPLFLELKAFIEETYAPDFLLIDARTGITEMGGVATTVLSDQVVCLMLPTREHLEGSRHVLHAIRAAPRPEGAGEVTILAALSRMPHKVGSNEAAEVLRVKNVLNAPIDELGTSLGIQDMTVLHHEPALEDREHILVGSGRSLDDSRLLQDYVRLFVKLVPPRDIEGSVGRLIDDIEKRVLEAPDESEQALEALANDCMHPEAYRALLRMYRMRRSPLLKRLHAAHTFWRITNDATEPLLWEAIKDYKSFPVLPKDQPNVDRLGGLEAIWQSHHPEDSRLAMVLSRDYEAADFRSRAIGVLETHASTPTASVEAVASLVRLLCKDNRQDDASQVIARHKESMANLPRFVDAWVEKALIAGSSEELQAILDDPCFDLTVVEKNVPALAARLSFFQTGDQSAARDFLDNASFALQPQPTGYRTPRDDLSQLGALAVDLGHLEAFKTRLAKSLPNSYTTILQQVEKMHPLPGYEMYPSPVDENPF